MHTETQAWHSPILNKDMKIRIYGHFGQPVLVFPTSGGDEREFEGQGMVEALAHHIAAGRVKFYCVNSVNNESWYNKQIHPQERARIQVLYDLYVATEVLPFIEGHCHTRGIHITTTGASFGAYHAANTLFKHPRQIGRCLALSGVYDLRRFMDGFTNENFYFNNPVDYMANLKDPAILQALHQCDIRLATGTGPYEDAAPSRAMSAVLSSRGIPHHLDDWREDGGHDWPFWKKQLDTYISRLF